MTITETVHPIRHPLPEERRLELVTLLNARLADTADLHSQLKQAHWNVKGIHFQQLHELFDLVADAVLPYVDEIAERITALGGTARGTVRMAAASSTLSEYMLDATEGDVHLEAVRDRLASYAGDNLKAIDTADELDDDATEDLLTEIQRVIDKHLYFVQSHLPAS